MIQDKNIILKKSKSEMLVRWFTIFVDYIDKLLKAIIALGIAVIMITIIFHVTGRYLFGKTCMGTMELIRYTMIWISLLGAGVAFRSKEHVKVNFFQKMLSPKGSILLALTGNMVLSCFLVAMISGGMEISINNFKQISLGLSIPMFFPYFAVPLGAFFMLLYLLENFLCLFVEFIAQEK